MFGSRAPIHTSGFAGSFTWSFPWFARRYRGEIGSPTWMNWEIVSHKSEVVSSPTSGIYNE